jgi:hypothetical protein
LSDEASEACLVLKNTKYTADIENLAEKLSRRKKKLNFCKKLFFLTLLLRRK